MDSIIAASFAESATLKTMMDSHMISLVKGKDKYSGSNLRYLDPETDFKVGRIVTRANESIQILANEPSLGLYRIQEHIHRTIPQIVQRKMELESLKKTVEGVSYDMDYSVQAVDSMVHIRHFINTTEALKSAIELKRLLDEKEIQEKSVKEEESLAAQKANQSLSENELAEGYICPMCYFAHENQQALMHHWDKEHNLEKYDNDPFTDLEFTHSESKPAAANIVDRKTERVSVAEEPSPCHVPVEGKAEKGRSNSSTDIEEAVEISEK